MTESDIDIKPVEKAETPRSAGLVPFEEMDRWFDEMVHRFDDVLGRRWWPPLERLLPSMPDLRAPFEGRVPRADLIDREAEVVIRAELPGVAKEDLDVSLAEDTVTIRAKSRYEAKEEKGEYQRRELSRGEFQRVFRLPAAVKGDEAKASFKDGVLELVLPKVAVARRRTIKVE